MCTADPSVYRTLDNFREGYLVQLEVVTMGSWAASRAFRDGEGAAASVRGTPTECGRVRGDLEARSRARSRAAAARLR